VSFFGRGWCYSAPLDGVSDVVICHVCKLRFILELYKHMHMFGIYARGGSRGSMLGCLRGQNTANLDMIKENSKLKYQLWTATQRVIHDRTVQSHRDNEHQNTVAELRTARIKLARAQHKLVLAQDAQITPLNLWNSILHVFQCNGDKRKDQSRTTHHAEDADSRAVHSIQRKLLSEHLHATCAPSTKK